jgi:hypothetical protein
MKLLVNSYIHNYYHDGFGGLGADDALTNIFALVRQAIEVPAKDASATVPGYNVGLGNQSVAFVWNISQAFIPSFDIAKEAAKITREPERSTFNFAYQAYQSTIAKIFGAGPAESMHDRGSASFVFNNASFGNMTSKVVDGQLVLTWAKQLLDTAAAADKVLQAPGTRQDIIDSALKKARVFTDPLSKTAEAIKWGSIALVAYIVYDAIKGGRR